MKKICNILGGLKCLIGYHQTFSVYDGTIAGEKGVMTYVVQHCFRCNAYLGTSIGYELWSDFLGEEE